VYVSAVHGCGKMLTAQQGLLRQLSGRSGDDSSTPLEGSVATSSTLETLARGIRSLVQCAGAVFRRPEPAPGEDAAEKGAPKTILLLQKRIDLGRRFHEERASRGRRRGWLKAFVFAEFGAGAAPRYYNWQSLCYRCEQTYLSSLEPGFGLGRAGGRGLRPTGTRTQRVGWKKRYRAVGAGAPARLQDIGFELYQYWVDMSNSLQARVPTFLLTCRANELKQERRTGFGPGRLTATGKRRTGFGPGRLTATGKPRQSLRGGCQPRERRGEAGRGAVANHGSGRGGGGGTRLAAGRAFEVVRQWCERARVRRPRRMRSSTTRTESPAASIPCR